MQLWYRDVLNVQGDKGYEPADISRMNIQLINETGRKRLTMRGWSRSSDAIDKAQARLEANVNTGAGDGAVAPDHEEPVVRR